MGGKIEGKGVEKGVKEGGGKVDENEDDIRCKKILCKCLHTHTCSQTDRPRTVSLLVLDAVIGFAPSSSAASPVF